MPDDKRVLVIIDAHTADRCTLFHPEYALMWGMSRKNAIRLARAILRALAEKE